MSLPRSIPLPHSFANAIPQPPTLLSPKGRRPQHFVSSIPTYSLSPAQKRSLKAQTRCFKSFLKLNTTSTRSASLPARIRSSRQPSDLVLNSYIYKERSNEDFALPNRANAARPSSSTSTRLGNVKELGDLEDDARVMGNDEQVAEGAEGVMEAENGNEVPSAHLHSVQLTSSQGGATKGLITRPAKTLSPSTASWFTSTASQYTSTTPYIPSNNTPVPPPTRRLPSIDSKIFVGDSYRGHSRALPWSARDAIHPRQHVNPLPLRRLHRLLVNGYTTHKTILRGLYHYEPIPRLRARGARHR